MMLIVTKQDIAKLSPALRAELLKLMFEQDEYWDAGGSHESVDSDDMYFPYPSEPMEVSFESDRSDTNASKTVIEAGASDITALVSNLSEKSIETLKLFANGDPVSVDDLVGEDKPYGSYIELKRSFVGPVNRRLRTVTKNRAAVLFRKESEGDDEILIGVKQVTADAIRSVLLKNEEDDHAK